MVAEAGAPQQGKAPIPPPQPDQDGDADMEVEEAEEPANMKIVRNYQRQDPRCCSLPQTGLARVTGGEIIADHTCRAEVQLLLHPYVWCTATVPDMCLRPMAGTCQRSFNACKPPKALHGIARSGVRSHVHAFILCSSLQT